jgi:hypothetical protein
MSDFEDNLRSLDLRQPAPEWQHEIARQCDFDEPNSIWRAWLWPSPVAWAALAMIWFAVAAVNQFEKPVPGESRMPATIDTSLIAYRLDEPDAFWPLAANLHQ